MWQFLIGWGVKHEYKYLLSWVFRYEYILSLFFFQVKNANEFKLSFVTYINSSKIK